MGGGGEQIERSGLFLLDHNGQTQVYSLVSGPPDVRVWSKHNSPIEEEDCVLIRVNPYSCMILEIALIMPRVFKRLVYLPNIKL